MFIYYLQNLQNTSKGKRDIMISRFKYTPALSRLSFEGINSWHCYSYLIHNHIPDNVIYLFFPVVNTFFQLDAVEMINVVKTIDGTGFYDYSKHEISDASKQKNKREDERKIGQHKKSHAEHANVSRIK